MYLYLFIHIYNIYYITLDVHPPKKPTVFIFCPTKSFHFSNQLSFAKLRRLAAPRRLRRIAGAVRGRVGCWATTTQAALDETRPHPGFWAFWFAFPFECMVENLGIFGLVFFESAVCFLVFVFCMKPAKMLFLHLETKMAKLTSYWSQESK